MTVYQTHSEALADKGIMTLMGDVTAENIKPVVEWILHENLVKKRKVKELQLTICSPGGDLNPGFALIDVIRGSKIPVKTIGLGTIASSGLLIFVSGSPGRRILSPNTSIMSHQFTWNSAGKAHELFALTKEFELTQQRMVNLYRRCTGLDDETIKQVLLPAQDVYLSAQEALQLNLCDHIA